MENINSKEEIHRRLPIGAELLTDGGVHFRVWAPDRKQVEVVLEGEEGDQAGSPGLSFRLTEERNGYFSGLLKSAKDGSLYRYRLDGGKFLYPDPVSRFQPDGPEGPSQVVDPRQFHWTDNNWPGVSLEGQVIYEMHIGAFTQQGNWDGAAQQLSALAETGITLIEIMPVADFSGHFGWGYDGVDLFAPTRLYGRPDDFRSFVNRAHQTGIGIILDVVYNHIGPVGNYLKQHSKSYFTGRYKNEWGESINFDGPNSAPVREYFIANAEYWIDEFHLDGLRLDATHQIFDNSPEHILAAITRQARIAAGARKIILVAENETQQTRIVRPQDQGGYGLDALWNDDFHHSAMVALTGRNEAYYSGYLGNPQEFISSIKWGFLYQGQRNKYFKARHGSPSGDLPPSTFVLYLQNHDQIANSSHGWRLQRLASPGLCRAMTALLLLAPGTPLLFQGQEFAASSPFFFFADVSPELAENIHQSRLKLLSRFRNPAQPEMNAGTPRPEDADTFKRSKINLAERDEHAAAYSLHRDLLKLRRQDPVFHAQLFGGVEGAVLGPKAFLLRFFDNRREDRLLIVNLGPDLHLDPAPEPLLAPPEGKEWELYWCSESPIYGGSGAASLETEANWTIAGESATVLKPTVPDG
jgi:maltooligosyltrehalose trehalohydrolase